MARKPAFLEQYWRRETPEAGLEGYWSKQLNKALNKVATTNLGTMTRDELKQVAKPIIREVNKRMRMLEEAGMEHSPAYRYIIDQLGKKPSAAGSNRNQIANNIRIATDFLHTKTSLVENAVQYDIWLDQHIGTSFTAEEKKELWDLIHSFEDSHPGRFINYGYDEAIRQISSAYHLSGKDKEAARQAFLNYMEGEGMLADMEQGTGEELREIGISPWWSTNDFMKGY